MAAGRADTGIRTTPGPTRPYDKTGHKGDLPAVYVTADGKATYPVLAPRLKVADLAGHALMIHVGGDNYSDHPAALGGRGGRMACGVVK